MRHVMFLASFLQLLALLLIVQVDALPRSEKAGSLNDLEVCYPGLGCFRKDGEFAHILYRPISLLPQSPEKINTRFILFTRKNREVGQLLSYGDYNSVAYSNFDAGRETKILIHGFGQDADSLWLPPMREALLKFGDYNVVIADWGAGSPFPYTQATANTRVAGAVTAQMIQWLQSRFGVSPSRIHIIGHSLGAHVAGYVGERLTPKLARITGMDPAGPYFEWMPPKVRLDETDASFVDVLHTDGNNTWSIVEDGTGFGLMQPLGHVDFYPNGGRAQPGCVKPPPLFTGDARFLFFCHHGRAHGLVTATISNPFGNYKAVPCESYEKFKAGGCSCSYSECATMGIRADEWKPWGRINVKMFLDTAAYSPYESP